MMDGDGMLAGAIDIVDMDVSVMGKNREQTRRQVETLNSNRIQILVKYWLIGTMSIPNNGKG